MDWMSLKSGSDVRGTAIGDGTVLNEEVACSLGMAFAFFLSDEKQKPVNEISVSIGRDSRLSGPSLLEAVSDGICRAGACVLDFGMCTTPAMYMSTVTAGYETDGAIMVTASHHPWNKNGLKFFTNRGGLEGKQIAGLLQAAESLNPSSIRPSGKVMRKPFLDVYKDQLASRIRAGLDTHSLCPLKGLHVVVDAGNGAGGFYADLMASLGADIRGSQFLDPDGKFPNHIPNPENPDAMKSLRNAVLSSSADLGVIFDADCDRAAVVDSDGREINRNRLIALISAILLEEQPGQTIVTDSVTSSGLTEFISRHGGEHYRYKRGYRNVIDEAIRLNGEGRSCPLAIETSGHAAMRENHFLDDGMYLVTVLIIRAMKMKHDGQHLGSLISDLREPVESVEIRMPISSENFRETGLTAVETITKHAENDPQWHIAPDNREGIRISFDLNGQPDSGWFLLRLSVHDPVLPLNAESDVPGGIRQMLSGLYDLLKTVDGISTETLYQAIQSER